MRKFFLILPLMIIAMAMVAQDAKQDFADGEFFLAQEEYEEALYTFTKVYNNGYEDNANVNYRIGICLLQIKGRKAEAVPYLEKAITMVSEKYNEGSLKEVNAPPDAHLYLGNAYRIQHEFEKSCEQYKLFKDFLDEEEEILQTYVDQQIESCAHAVVAINRPEEFTVGNLGQINKTHADIYNMVVSHDMQTLAFMGRNPFYNGVYVSRKKDGLWQRPLGINASIVSEGNMDVVSLSPDGNTMLIAVTDEFSSNIYRSEYSNDRWNPAESMGKPINSRYFESHASYNPEMNSIFFTSNRNGSLGGMDIFRSDQKEDGSWGNPVRLDENVNTPLNEETPVMSPDGKRLYYASQGHNSIGGFDVFYSELQEDGSWGKAVNMGYPMNTTDDDFTLIPNGFQSDEEVFLFTGGDAVHHQLFKFEMIGRDETPVEVPFGLTKAEQEAAEAERLAQAEAEKKALEEAEKKALEEAEEKVIEEAETVPEPEVVTPEKYMIHAVFFGFDSFALNDQTKKELDDIASVLSSFPELNLEIFGHTDAIGTTEYNQLLSEWRANAVSEYLLKKGLSADRLTVTGKSENEAVARNRTKDNRDAPDGRKLNRRVEFKVSVADKVVVEMEKIEVPEHLRL